MNAQTFSSCRATELKSEEVAGARRNVLAGRSVSEADADCFGWPLVVSFAHSVCTHPKIPSTENAKTDTSYIIQAGQAAV